jgi:hypothetical protein
MNVGFRPRLKARPSVYDLIRNRSIDSLSVRRRGSFTEELLSELPPLPSTPTEFPSPPPTPAIATHPKPVQESDNTAPKKAVAKDADGEDQYGMPLTNYELCTLELIVAIQVRFILSPGTKLPQPAQHYNTDTWQTSRGGREYDRRGYVRIGRLPYPADR